VPEPGTATSVDRAQTGPQLFVLRVFCDEQGVHGNPLGVVLAGAAVARAQRQTVAAVLGFSETVFVDDHGTAELQIFTPKAELRLAGHPLVGTSWLLRQAAGGGFDRTGDAASVDGGGSTAGAVGEGGGRDVSILRPPAGEVPTAADAVSAWIEADPADAPPFGLRQLATAAEVEALEVPRGPEVHDDVWAWIDPDARTQVRCRVFADQLGIPEDEATGSAALRLVAAVGRPVTILQGAGSVIEARPTDDGRVRVGGRVVLDRCLPLADALREYGARA